MVATRGKGEFAFGTPPRVGLRVVIVCQTVPLLTVDFFRSKC